MVKLETTHYILGAGALVGAGALYLAFRNGGNGGGDLLERPGGTVVTGNGVTGTITVNNTKATRLDYKIKLRIVRASVGVVLTQREYFNQAAPNKSVVETMNFTFPSPNPVFPEPYTFFWELTGLSGEVLARKELTVMAQSSSSAKIMRVTGAARHSRVGAR